MNKAAARQILAEYQIATPIAPGHLDVLIEVAAPGYHVSRRMAHDLGVSASTVCRAVRKLGDLELVCWKADPDDARVWLLSATPRGRRLAAALMGVGT